MTAWPKPFQWSRVSTTTSPVTEAADVAVKIASTQFVGSPSRAAQGSMSRRLPASTNPASANTNTLALCRMLGASRRAIWASGRLISRVGLTRFLTMRSPGLRGGLLANVDRAFRVAIGLVALAALQCIDGHQRANSTDEHCHADKDLSGSR
jgi:hypothetical protein